MYRGREDNYQSLYDKNKYNNLEDLHKINPNFDEFNKSNEKHSVKKIFRVSPEDLNLFFSKRNLKFPDNQGESRISLNILKHCGYS
jgi:hypothetical protein